MLDIAQINPHKLHELGADQLRELTQALLHRTGRDAQELIWRDAKIDKLSFEIAQLKRLQFGVNSEQLSIDQRALFDEAVDGDIAAIEEQIAALQATLPPKADARPRTPKRAPLPVDLPRVDRHHDPENTACTTPGCGCAMRRIGEDVSEKLDYTPGDFTVERHVRGKWARTKCCTLVQAAAPAAVTDKDRPNAGLLVHVLAAKHADHLPLYRQEAIFGPAGVAIPRSTLGAWVGQCGVRLQLLVDARKTQLLPCDVLHADETPVSVLAPGKSKT